MKLNTYLALPLLLTALLSACGDKSQPAAVAKDAATATTEVGKDAVKGAAAAVEAAPKATEPGGYEPTAEERVPGITRAVESAPVATPEAMPTESPAADAPAIPAEAPTLPAEAPAK